MKRENRSMCFGIIFLGFVFFFNPTIAVIDVLPDFIGCIIIWLGLSRLSLIHPNMQAARSGFLKLALIDVAKSLSLIVIFGMGNHSEQPTLLLVAAFAAAVVELLFLIPAFRSLFDGLFSMASRYDCIELYGDRGGRLSRTDLMYRMTVIFLIVREAVCLLPELTSLTTSSFSDSRWDRIYEYIGVMRTVACLLVGVAGIAWLVSLALYYRRLRRQTEMMQGLWTVYQEYYSSHPGIAVKRRHGASLTLLFAGALLLTDFYLDFQNVLPDALAGLLLAAGALIPAVPRMYRICTACLAVTYSVVAYISSELSYEFLREYSVSEIGKSQAADAAYRNMWLLSLLEFVLFMALLVMLLLLLRAVVRKWAGYRAQHTQNEFEERCQKSMFSDFDGQLLLCSVMGFISGLFSFLYDYIKVMPGKGIYHLLEYLWIFDFCAAIVFAAVLGATLYRIYGEIKNRYQFD